MRQSAVLVLQMDTPGGPDTSMREIIREIVNAPVPVLTWIGPSGARAASAGTQGRPHRFSTIVFPFPTDLASALAGMLETGRQPKERSE